MEIKKIAAHYRQYLARMIKQSTRADYTKRLEMLVCYASMQGITAIEDIDFTQFLEWVFIGRGVAPRTHNNCRTWCLSFCEWCRQREYLKGNPLEGIKPLRETPKQSPVKHLCVFISFHSSYVVVHVLIQAQRFRASALFINNTKTSSLYSLSFCLSHSFDTYKQNHYNHSAPYSYVLPTY